MVGYAQLIRSGSNQKVLIRPDPDPKYWLLNYDCTWMNPHRIAWGVPRCPPGRHHARHQRSQHTETPAQPQQDIQYLIIGNNQNNAIISLILYVFLLDLFSPFLMNSTQSEKGTRLFFKLCFRSLKRNESHMYIVHCTVYFAFHITVMFYMITRSTILYNEQCCNDYGCTVI